MAKSKRQTRKTSGKMVSVSSTSSNGNTLYDREFRPDYSQTVKDLRRIAILASSFIGLLVVLSFFLR